MENDGYFFEENVVYRVNHSKSSSSDLTQVSASL